MKALGLLLILLFLAAIIAMYHKLTQEMYDEAAREELEDRFCREIEFRWQNQNIRIRQELRIIDEMRR